MSVLSSEIKANFESFRGDWMAQAQANWKALEPLPCYLESYRRIAALHALKNDLVLANFSSDSAAFFLEAHNDALVSHVAASGGSWRSALQALRSSLENTLNAIYYKDHPIELQLWLKGNARLAFSELFSYMERHPNFSPFSNADNGLQFIKEEYGTLSRAVHGSALNFRMTDSAAAVLLWSTEKAKAGAWASREGKAIEAIALLFVYLFPDKLSGAQVPGLRSILGYAISTSKRDAIKSNLGVTIPAPEK